jgi:hypothetical protein
MLVENPLETLQHMGGCALSCEFKLLVSQNDYGPYLLSVYCCAPHQGLQLVRLVAQKNVLAYIMSK